MKLPNGFGSISYLGANRREPFYARKTIGRNELGRPIQKPIEPKASFATYNEAYEALLMYNKYPWEEKYNTTFSEAYEQWSVKYFAEKELSESRKTAYLYAYNGCKSIYSYKLHDLTTSDYENVLESSDKSEMIKINMRALMIKLCSWGMKYGIVDKNYAELTDSITRPNAAIVRKIFSSTEVKKLWSLPQSPIVDMVLLSIYCGLRPSEVCKMKTEDIHLEEQYMVGGVKTAAGIRRVIPIHNDVAILVQRNMGADTLFRRKNKPWAIKSYPYHFNKLMESVDMAHLPHDCRHTFITRAKECKINEYCLKLIVGHAINDITEKVYTHRKPEELLAEVNKVTFIY